MSASDNKEMLRGIYVEVAKGNPQPFLDAMSDDVRWTLIGSTKFSGSYSGKQNVLEKFLAPVLAEVDGHMELTPHNFIADGDYVAMQATGKSLTKYGKRYDNTYCHVFRIVDGKIREITEYCDTELITQAFSA
jgi:hypothetical protein